MTPPVFVDTDVVISSLLSEKGAAHLLLKSAAGDFFISNFSEEEIYKVGERFKISRPRIRGLLKRLGKVSVSEGAAAGFVRYVLDGNDAHIVTGAAKAGAKFLVTYNGRHFQIDRIKEDLGIIVLSPALFLQWLRSRGGVLSGEGS